MKRSWTMTLAALAAGLLMGLPSAALAAACGDINNDGNVNSNDSVCLAGCVAGNGVCPSAATLPQCGPGPICTTGNPLDCADIVKDNDFNLPEIQADLNNLSLSLVGIETLTGLKEQGRKAQEKILGIPGRLEKVAEYIESRSSAKTFSFDLIFQRTFAME